MKPKKINGEARVILVNKGEKDYVFDSGDDEMLIAVRHDEKMYQVVRSNSTSLTEMFITMFIHDGEIMQAAYDAFEQVADKYEKPTPVLFGASGKRLN